jgi:hypothetical protein
MVYNPEKFEDVKIGLKSETVVESVVEGTQESFRPEEYWEAVKDATPEEIKKMRQTLAIKIIAENGASIVLNLPTSNLISPKSKLFSWKKTYGDYPKKGQKITTKVDNNGFNAIVLEQ